MSCLQLNLADVHRLMRSDLGVSFHLPPLAVDSYGFVSAFLLSTLSFQMTSFRRPGSSFLLDRQLYIEAYNNLATSLRSITT